MTSAIPDIEISDFRNEATGYALTVDLRVGFICETCPDIHPSLKRLAKATKKGWKSTNESYVNAADEYLDMVTAKLARTTDEESATLFYLSTTERFITDARHSATILLGRTRPTERRCELLLKKISKGMFRFSANPDYFPTLEEIRRDMESVKKEKNKSPASLRKGRFVQMLSE